MVDINALKKIKLNEKSDRDFEPIGKCSWSNWYFFIFIKIFYTIKILGKKQENLGTYIYFLFDNALLAVYITF